MSCIGDVLVDNGEIFVYTGSSRWEQITDDADDFVKELIQKNVYLEKCIKN